MRRFVPIFAWLFCLCALPAHSEAGMPLNLLGFTGPAPAMNYHPAISNYQLQGRTDEDSMSRTLVSYPGLESAGTVVIDTSGHHLYYVLGGGKAIRYGIGVGRDGFRWRGVQTVSRKAEWPTWTPPPQMIVRQPYLPRFMAGGPGNPLGARALYLGSTEYRIHGTNDPTTIGKNVSSGCIRLTNADVEDLYARVPVGTKVVVQ